MSHSKFSGTRCALILCAALIFTHAPVRAADADAHDEPAGCPNVGDQCSDGSYYAGLSPDGNRAMYVTDESYEVIRTWDDARSKKVADLSAWGSLDVYKSYSIDTEMENCVWRSKGALGTESSCQSGEANTMLLAKLKPSLLQKLLRTNSAPYPAAKYCDELEAHGHDDWYLPAQSELHLLWNKGDPIANVKLHRQPLQNWVSDGQDVRYWSSSELNEDQVWVDSFSTNNACPSGGRNEENGCMINAPKQLSSLVRCARKN